MLDYRKKHGSLIFEPNCGGEDAEIRAWIYSQRRLLRTKKMPRRRLSILKAANFEWKRGVIHQDRWNEMYNRLVSFYETHGHLVVTAKKNTLGTWICRQRAQRRAGTLSQDRIDKLNKLPFSWSGTDVELQELQQQGWDHAPSNFYFKEWNERFKEMMEFKERFGHMEVSRGYNETLSVWIFRQRKLYSRGTLREERVARLNSVGFSWEMNPKRSKKVTSSVGKDGKPKLEENSSPLGKHEHLSSSHSTQSATRKRKIADLDDENEDSEYEDENMMRKGGKPMSERARRKARRDNNVYEEAKNSSSLLAVRSTRDRSKMRSQESATTNASIENEAPSPLMHVSTPEPTQLFDETARSSELLDVRPARGRPTRKASMRKSLKTKARTKKRESPPSKVATPPPADNVYPIGTQILNFFPGHGWYIGTVQAVDKQKYTVVYDDGDVEEFLIDGPTMDALVELAKSNPEVGLGDAMLAIPKACDTSAPMRASDKGHSGALKRSQDVLKVGGMTIKKALLTGINLSGESRNATEGNVTSEVLQGDEVGKPTETDSLVSAKAKVAEYEVMLKQANEVAAMAQAELKKMSTLLRQRERKCLESAKLIDKLKARIADLEQSQFVTGSVAHKVLSRLQDKL